MHFVESDGGEGNTGVFVADFGLREGGGGGGGDLIADVFSLPESEFSLLLKPNAKFERDLGVSEQPTLVRLFGHDELNASVLCEVALTERRGDPC